MPSRYGRDRSAPTEPSRHLGLVAMAGRGGPVSGMPAALGVAAGALVHAVSAALGLSALFTTLPVRYHVLRRLGAAYFLYLAVKAFRDRSPLAAEEDGTAATASCRT